MQEHVADLKRHRFAGPGKKAIFPEGGNTTDLQIGAEAAAGFFHRNTGVPRSDCLKGRRADESGAGGLSIVREAAVGILGHSDRLLKLGTQPGFQGGLLGRHVKTDFFCKALSMQAKNLLLTVPGAAKTLHQGKSLGIHEFALGIEQRILTVKCQCAGRENGGFA